MHREINKNQRLFHELLRKVQRIRLRHKTLIISDTLEFRFNLEPFGHKKRINDAALDLKVFAN